MQIQIGAVTVNEGDPRVIGDASCDWTDAVTFPASSYA
jgi:hypothetical protein